MSKPDSRTLVDLERYPLETSSDPRTRTVITTAQRDLARQNVCQLPGFIIPDGITRLAAESGDAARQGFRRTQSHTCYISQDDDPAWPEGHPRRRQLPGSYVITAFDLLAQDAALRALYCWPPLRNLVARILGHERLYLHECPYQALNILAQDEGDTNSWHFDTENEFTVTLLMQRSVGGGRFEITPNIRSKQDESYEAVGRVLDGDDRGVLHFDVEPGTLVIFRGLHSLHRSSPVEGPRRRLIAVMLFERHPGVTGTAAVNAMLYGPRVAAQVNLPTG